VGVKIQRWLMRFAHAQHILRNCRQARPGVWAGGQHRPGAGAAGSRGRDDGI